VLRTVLSNRVASKAILAIGPEGGWTDEERDAGLKAGFHEASFGRLILRTETAVIAALASLSYAFGE
jgi:16S rRNA (uracil1498-N3)-methyltransferase